MIDPNLIYKAKFAELTELLGRTPVSTDAGWLALHEEYKKSWGPAEKTVFAPRARENGNGRIDVTADSGRIVRSSENERVHLATGGIGSENAGLGNSDISNGHESEPLNSAAGTQEQGFSRKPAPQAGGIGAVGHAREDGEATGGPGAIQTGAGAGTAGTRVDSPSRIYQAGRGPGGGVLAVCEGCGEVWEREKRRGRPSLMCEECR